MEDLWKPYDDLQNDKNGKSIYEEMTFQDLQNRGKFFTVNTNKRRFLKS